MRVSIVRIKGVKGNLPKFTKTMHEKLVRVWQGAVRAYLEEIVKGSPQIHVDTGMSMASLLPLAAEVRMKTVVRAAINPRVPSRKGMMILGPGGGISTATYDPNKVRSMAAGEQLGRKAYVLNYGSAGRPVMKFSFSIDVFQYLFHEEGNGTLQAYNTLQRGQDAFAKYLLEHANEAIPRLNEWLDPERSYSYVK
jgi:hypothetical protein